MLRRFTKMIIMNATARNSFLSAHRGVLWILVMTILVFLLFAMAAAWIGETETDASRSDDGDFRLEIRTQEENQ
jgi:hypothetical protein